MITVTPVAVEKIKEAMLAIQIEKRYTKNEIFTLYCNQMYFGHGVYGVQAASRLYFGKTAKDLTLEEAALIAGILQGNVRQSPYVNMDAAVRRRNYALSRMAEVGFITETEAEAARKKPIVLRGEPSTPASVAPYFLEEVRKDPALQGTFIILLTAKGQDSDREKGLALGANEFMTKPFSPAVILTRMREILAAPPPA